MTSLFWVGALLALVASMSGTAGKQLLRFSELQRRRGGAAARCASRISLFLGLFLNVVVGPLIDMAAYAFAPQSIVAPLTGLDVVWNTMSAPCTLGESLTPTLVAGCVLIAGGATVTSVVGSHHDQSFTPTMLKEAIFRWAVLIYFAALGGFLAFNVFVLMPRSSAPKGEPWASGDKLRGLALGLTAGSIAGNMFCVKAFVELVQAAIRDRDSEYWNDWFPYVIFIGAVFFATSNLYFLTKAMREYEALFMGAVFEGAVIVAACVSGIVVFSELQGISWWGILTYWMALFGIVVGIVVVAKGCSMHVKIATVDDKVEVVVIGETPGDPEQEFGQPRPMGTSHAGHGHGGHGPEIRMGSKGSSRSLQSVASAHSRGSWESAASRLSKHSEPPFRGLPLAIAAWGTPGELHDVVVIS